ncbi:putative baseplate assembly protein [Tumidithrix helvetica PCC 7403]|uniref:putative baseplate assembly protein n=1 Tax=Tumidithrix helvetica TaxID=3457545 RepID=UPI003CB31D07
MSPEFDFLPNLPKSDLDDRTFQDLVNECLLRIPRYCPEWTNYNPSDPGVTLIELFAWLADQMLMRFNKVPRRNYVAFLELLGIRLLPPAPAQTDVTFYLSASLPEVYVIPVATEVATIRTETEESVVFSTDRPLAIGKPTIRHLLTAETVETVPLVLRDRFTGVWSEGRDRGWEGPELSIFNDEPRANNCFYLVFDAEQPIEGNVIAVQVKGEAATSTGINPDIPPRHWEAWNGIVWEPILLRETDDRTKGFSFSDQTSQGGSPSQGAEVILHLPQYWPITQFTNYRGRWIRCVCSPLRVNQPGYSRSPRIIGLNARSIGGTIGVTQSRVVTNEIVGESKGTPSQIFQLLQTPILPRTADEYVLVTPPMGLPQIWQEVTDFSSSGTEDLHYVLDSQTGTIQFGPMVHAPSHLQAQIVQRMRLQGNPMERIEPDALSTNSLATAVTGRQYGAIPPKGSTIQMVKYRTGGGLKGNVQRGTIRFLKTAVPYVASLINHVSAYNGADAESLDDAAIRVPSILRTRNRAVTKEDFETLTLEAGSGAIARVMCLTASRKEDAGIVRLLLVPQVNTEAIELGNGIDPDRLALSPQLNDRVVNFLDERRLLGVQIRCSQPEYVGVSVQTEISLDPEYRNPQAQQEVVNKLQVVLYRFLNPLTGGQQGKGWEFGRPVYPSDIVKLLQTVRGVRYLGTVQLFELRQQEEGWVRTLPREPIIDPGPLGLICSWRNSRLRSSHVISVV